MRDKFLMKISTVTIAFSILALPVVARVAGISSIVSENRALTAAPTTSDGWSYIHQLGKFLNDRLALRDKSISIDSFIDRRFFGEEPAFGGAATPRILEGSDGFLFLKDAFDAACNGHGTPESVTANVKRFADIIQRSGRKIVVTIAPDKSSILLDKLPKDNPQSECHRLHQDQQWKALAEAQIPGYIDMRSVLREEVAKYRRPLYFRQDSHWNMEGSLPAVREVVNYFSPNIWKASDVRFSGLTKYLGDLEGMRGGTKMDETPNFEIIRDQIKIEKSEYDEAFPPGYRRLSEMSGPDGSLIEGKTFLLFDSFGIAAIEQIVPYFENLTTTAFESFETDKWIEDIKASDNVWFLCVERGLGYRLTYDMGNKTFLDALDKALNG